MKTLYNPTAYTGHRVVVLGAAGFIGRWLARALCAQGANVYLVCRKPAAAEEIFAEYGILGHVLEADLRNPLQVRDILEEWKPSIAFNAAGYGIDRSERDETTTYQINAGLPEAVCMAMAAVRDPAWSGQDVVHIGSALEYGQVGGNLAEDSEPNPTTLYGKSKLAGTNAVSRCCSVNGLKGLTARLFTVYGPGEHAGRLLPSLLQTAKTCTALQLTAGQQKRDFTYVEDVAEGLLRLGVAPAVPGETVNLATGRLTSVRAFVEVAAGILQIPADRLKFAALPTRQEEMEHLEVIPERLRQLTSWTPATRIAEGIRKTWGIEAHGWQFGALR